jgi:arabinofuranosyltransferase
MAGKIALSLLSLATLVSVYFGWRLFWFLTDDAFIAFRYVSNSRLGYGYVWNAPPFRPVEGYTSFLWVVLLDLFWRITGVDPPRSANYLSLVFVYLTLLTGALMVLKMDLRDELRKHRVLLLGLVFAGVITNRTFLAWTSSGLETAMFNFFLTLWVYCCLFLPAYTIRWAFGISLAASLIYLTRPDGLLFAFITLGLAATTMLVKQKISRLSGRRVALAASPLLIIPAHLLWRRTVYGAWLSNTYYAKTIAGRIWPQSGIRYLLSFLIEYSLWIWVMLLVAVILARVRRRSRQKISPGVSIVNAAVCAALLGQFLYYTIVVGGDHFEYRVYSHLVLLAFISFLWMLNALRMNLWSAISLCAALIVLSWPIPWMHWSATHNLIGRQRTVVLMESVAKVTERRLPSTPGFLLAYLRAFDSLQFWLIGHAVCMRHQEHKNFYLDLISALPSRDDGMRIPDTGYPVLTANSVGVKSWVLPRVNLIDTLGLNDYVVARNPDTHTAISMAHERQTPEGYEECFSPNVFLEDKHFVVRQRAVNLTAAKIVECEQKYAALVQNPDASKRAPPLLQNPIDDPRFFVRQQYLDVLNREPDPLGITNWTDGVARCPTGSTCFNDSRENIPIIFFDAGEFQEKPFFVYRIYRASYGAVPSFLDFKRDEDLLQSYRVEDWRDPEDFLPPRRFFLDQWVRRGSFLALYPETMTPDDFVNHLFDMAGLKQSGTERQRQIEAMRAGKSRAEVLLEVVDMDEFRRRENGRALALMQILMQLRRDVDFNEETYKPWLDKLARNEPVDYRRFICQIFTSAEYQRRFGAVVTHTNSECQ